MMKIHNLLDCRDGRIYIGFWISFDDGTRFHCYMTANMVPEHERTIALLPVYKDGLITREISDHGIIESLDLAAKSDAYRILDSVENHLSDELGRPILPDKDDDEYYQKIE
jgi:hypothetical protein